MIYLFEIKNFEGDFYFEELIGIRCQNGNFESDAPIEKNLSLLRRLLLDWGYNYHFRKILCLLIRSSFI